MMTPFQSEPAYAALFTLLSATQLLTNGQPNGTLAFKTYSRLAIPVSTSTPAQQPALYIMEGEIEFSPLDDMGLSTDQYKAAAIVYFTNPGWMVVEAVDSADGGMCLVVNGSRVAGCEPSLSENNIRYRWNVRREYLQAVLTVALNNSV